MAKRIRQPGPTLRYMTDEEFEDEASLLLAEYSNKHDHVIAPPIPVDEIVELYFKLRLEFLDMKKLFGVDDVHGALWVNEKRVGIDQRLDPAQNPAKLGRYHFTLAHEAGHWRLHRHLFQRRANQLSLFPEGVDRPEYICRSSDTTPIEYQANRFASCLLMPREMIKRAWHEWHGDMDPIYLPDLRAERGNRVADEIMLEDAVRPMAAKFQVSPEAMRIRTEGFGLLLRKKEVTLF
jgi:IrrE N-terminal-like domain